MRDQKSATKERTFKARYGLLCTKLNNSTALEMRQLKRLLRYVKGTEDMSTVFEMRDNNDSREQLVKRLEVYTGRYQRVTVVARDDNVWDTMKLKLRWIVVRHTHSSIDEVLDA